METKLLEILHKYNEENPGEIPYREYQSLITLIIDGDIKTLEDLAYYGVI